MRSYFNTKGRGKHLIAFLLLMFLFSPFLMATTEIFPPLIKAAKDGDLDAVKRELASGVDVNLVNSNGDTALYYAALCDKNEVAKFLLESGANPNHVSLFGSCPMECAAGQGNLALIKLMVEHDGRVQPKDSEAVSP